MASFVLYPRGDLGQRGGENGWMTGAGIRNGMLFEFLSASSRARGPCVSTIKAEWVILGSIEWLVEFYLSNSGAKQERKSQSHAMTSLALN